MWNYIRRKDNNLVVKSFGYCDFTGQFDTNIYEQVSGNGPESLPDGYSMEPFPLTLSEKIINVVNEKTDSEKVQILKIKQAIEDAVNNSWPTVADGIIDSIDDSLISSSTKTELKATYN